MVVLALAACGGTKDDAPSNGSSTTSSAPSGPQKWSKAAWKSTEVELEDGVKLTVDIPEGIPVNADYMLGKDRWVGANSDDFKHAAGPRLTLDNPRERTFDAETLARYVEPDATRADLVEIAKEKTADGRVRYASAVKGNSHIDVTVWLPLADPTKGIKCTAHWWKGLRANEPENPPPPDPAIVAFLEKFCASVKLAP